MEWSEAVGSLSAAVEGMPASLSERLPASMSAAVERLPPFDERPEIYVGAAFAGGLVLAQLLRSLAGRG